MSTRSTGAQQAMTGNRTGLQTSPELAEELIEGASSATPSSDGGPEEIAEYRGDYIVEGFPIGSMPTMPASEEAEADEDAAGTQRCNVARDVAGATDQELAPAHGQDRRRRLR